MIKKYHKIDKIFRVLRRTKCVRALDTKCYAFSDRNVVSLLHLVIKPPSQIAPTPSASPRPLNPPIVDAPPHTDSHLLHLNQGGQLDTAEVTRVGHLPAHLALTLLGDAVGQVAVLQRGGRLQTSCGENSRGGGGSVMSLQSLLKYVKCKSL